MDPRQSAVVCIYKLGLTASLVSQIFLREFFYKENETRFSRKYQCESRESHESCKKGKMRYIVKLVSLTIYESRNSQTSKIIIHSEKLVLVPNFLQDSRKTPQLKLVLILASLATKFLFAKLASLTTKIVCEKRVLL